MHNKTSNHGYNINLITCLFLIIKLGVNMKISDPLNCWAWMVLKMEDNAYRRHEKIDFAYFKMPLGDITNWMSMTSNH